MNNMRKINGLTLLETLLVLAIAASVILLGVRIYQAFKIDRDFVALQNNVNTLFQAMKIYYQIECNIYFKSDGTVGRGTLIFDPTKEDLIPVKFPIDNITQYGAQNWPEFTTLVGSGPNSEIYFAQFNPTIMPNSSVIIWQLQIGVKVKDSNRAVYYRGRLNADCATDTDVRQPIICAVNAVTSGKANYLVWQRPPSFASLEIQSQNWLSYPNEKEFRLQYMYDSMYELSNLNTDPGAIYKYYYCGG